MRKICMICGEFFETSRSPQKYCSDKCARASVKKIRPKPEPKKKVKSLAEVNAEAKAAGMNYGEWSTLHMVKTKHQCGNCRYRTGKSCKNPRSDNYYYKVEETDYCTGYRPCY